MALNFIKKVFSFGRNKEVVPDPATEPAPEAATQSLPETAPAPEAPADAPEQSFPQDGAMQFTPETAPADELSPPAPADEDHAGEPPIPDQPAETAAEAPDEGLPPEEITADPAIAPAPDGEIPPAPETAPELAVTPAQPVHAEPVAEGPEDGLAPEELTADPAIAPVPDETPAPAVAPVPEEGPEPAAQSEPEPEPEPAAQSEPEPEPATQPEPEPAPAPLPRNVVVRDTVSAREPVVAPEPVQEEKSNWWQRLRKGLSRTSGQLTGQISGIFTKRKLDEDTLEELEDILLQADLGVETAMRITDALSASRYGKDISPAEVQKVMADEITRVLQPVARPLELDLSHKPHVILVVGVNGTGKTTTIGKLSAKLSAGGLKVMLAAGDTFRAAAIEQLKIWGDRTGSKVVSTKLGADAAGLAYEAFETARTDGADVLIIDTAGRLQNRTELMDELAKVVRVIGKLDPEAPHTVLLTLDATTGQNALGQVEIFKNVAGVNGLVMTKLDGTARGGILVAIAAKHKLPVYFVGVGEGVDDLEPFEAADFASAIAGQPAGDMT
ncbi:signal recognition particle-docking protein FtsY [Hoeflea ulvae]|uniref:Signal recognition particle receptor FtsY n=1 Tax=Hoeflea ulvae TaxID=2983764 RepID=A0ABT3Y9Z8_9HYPH|nr:signal recognition particle-docking protein FtsY [Hoeflea ulvae]MCY0092706.1 signal recognition particle-docking protein FtsY [Hoeflea ulvae]